MERKQSRAILICGFLGSGKTTLLKEILSWREDLKDTAVIVNELGDVGIDGDLLKDKGSNVVELTSGCICCTIQADLRTTLLRLLGEYHPSWLLIEATGLADPEGMIPVFLDQEVRKRVDLFKVVTVLDAEYWEGREMFGPLFENQLRLADTIILNKVDLMPQTQVPAVLESISNAFPSKQIIPTVYAKVDPDLLFLPPLKEGGLEDTHFPLFTHEHEHHHTESLTRAFSFHGYTSFAYKEKVIFKFECIKELLNTLPINIFRIKGWLLSDKGSFLINLAGGKGIFEKVNEDINNRLVFIGWDIDVSSINEKLEGCVI